MKTLFFISILIFQIQVRSDFFYEKPDDFEIENNDIETPFDLDYYLEKQLGFVRHNNDYRKEFITITNICGLIYISHHCSKRMTFVSDIDDLPMYINYFSRL